MIGAQCWQKLSLTNSSLGFQFKCFAEYKGHTFKAVKKALEENGFTDVTEGQGGPFCAWFLLPETPNR